MVTKAPPALPSTFMEAPDCRMLCSSTEHWSGDSSGHQAASSCLSGEVISDRGLSAQTFTISIQKWEASKHCEAEPFILLLAGKDISSSDTYPLFFFLLSNSLEIEGEYSFSPSAKCAIVLGLGEASKQRVLEQQFLSMVAHLHQLSQTVVIWSAGISILFSQICRCDFFFLLFIYGQSLKFPYKSQLWEKNSFLWNFYSDFLASVAFFSQR